MGHLKIKVVPGASRSGISGWLGDELKLRVSAPPEKGKANKAILSLLASTLKMPRNTLSLASGTTSAHKVIAIEGLSDEDVRRRLDNAIKSTD